MTSASPCVGVCALDDATGFCVGCARTGDEIASWRGQTPSFRAAVWDALPARFARLGVRCRRLPWETADIAAFVVGKLRTNAGTWVIGVDGAVAEFRAPPGAKATVETDGARIVATVHGGALRFVIDDHVRALTVDPPETPADLQRVTLAVKRARARPPAHAILADLGPDEAAVRDENRSDRLYDLGVGSEDARFCVRSGPGAAQDRLATALGAGFSEALARIGPALVRASPARVVESALGRIEVWTSIPPPDGRSPAGPHTHLPLGRLRAGRATPIGMELPPAYAPGAIHYPTR